MDFVVKCPFPPDSMSLIFRCQNYNFPDAFLLVVALPHPIDPVLIPGLAAPPSSALKLDHHDGDVVGATTVEGLEDYALGTEVGLVQTLAHEPHRLLVAEGVPQPVRGEDHELRLQLIQVEGHYVGIGNDHVEVFQWVVAQGAGHC